MENDKHYTAEEIRQYHEGKLSPKEMHALERAALDDPFLADALEGYQYTSTPNEDLIYIQNKLKQRGGGKVVSMFGIKDWLRVAALIIFIAGAGWMGFSLLNNKNESGLAVEALKRKNNTQDDLTQAAPPAAPAGNNAVAADSAQIETNSDNQTSFYNYSNKTKPINKNKEQEKNIITHQQDNIGAISSSPSVAFKDAAPAGRRGFSKELNASNNAVALNSFSGKVIDNNGKPIAYSTVINRTNNQALSTDSNGYFSFKSPDTAVSVDIAAIGYNNERQQLKNKELNRIKLQQNSADLNEVVVTGYAMKRAKKAPSSNIQIEGAEPVEGIDNYYSYVINYFQNKKIQSSGVGEVKIEFDVDENGEPTNIEILESTCDACDEDAIQILKQGPKWKKLKSKKGQIIIAFTGKR